jgi:hypothetical protein
MIRETRPLSQLQVTPKTTPIDDDLQVECDDERTLSAFMIFCTREIGSRDLPASLASAAVGVAVRTLPFDRSEGLSSGDGGSPSPARSTSSSSI